MLSVFPQLTRYAAASTCVLSLAGSAAAQQVPATIRLSPEDIERGGSGHQHNFFFLAPGATGEQYTDAGFWGQKLRPYLAGNEEALSQLNKYRRQKTTFLINRLAAMGAVGVYGQQVLAHTEKEEYFNPTQKVAIGVFATSLLSTFFINHNTNRYMQRAVSAYNVGKSGAAVWPRLRPTTVGLGSVGQRPVLTCSWSLR